MKYIILLLLAILLSGCTFTRSTEPVKVNDMTAEVPTLRVHF